MDGYLNELIERMVIKEKVSASEQSVSFAAYREAEKLDDVKFLPQLKAFVETHRQKNKKNYRNAAYFIMGKILIKNPVLEYVNFLLDCSLTETDKYIISSILNRMADIKISEEINIKPIIECTKSDKWLIRHSAIGALKLSKTDLARQTAIDFLKPGDMKRNQYDILYAVAALGHIGKNSDIPIIKPLLTAKVKDIRDTAKYTIIEIEKRGI